MSKSAAKRKQKEGPEVQQASDGRFELVKPPRALLDFVTVRPATPGTFNPIKNAENQLSLMKTEYPKWLATDVKNLSSAWSALRDSPSDPQAFRQFHHNIHIILGNGAILGSEAASNLARPIAKLLERNPVIERHLEIIGLATSSICLAISEKLPASDPKVEETVASLDLIVDRWVSSKAANWGDAQ